MELSLVSHHRRGMVMVREAVSLYCIGTRGQNLAHQEKVDEYRVE